MAIAIHKSKQYWLIAVKVTLFVLALGYIVIKISNERHSVLDNLSGTLSNTALSSLLFFVSLAMLNWLLEIYKWQMSVGTWFSITFPKATKQSLGSLTASLITPNRIGEFGAKALYFKPKNRKKILLLNFVHSNAQMMATLLFGVPALAYFCYENQIFFNFYKIGLVSIIVLSSVFLGYVFRKKKWLLKEFSIQDVWKKTKSIPSQRMLSIFLLSVLRYLVFGFLFYAILLFFGADVSLAEAIIPICAMYLLVSIVPSFFVMDVVIRGGVAVWLFSFLGVPEITVLSTVLVMWLLNVVLPAILGGYYVLSFKPKHS